jgi:DNA invertase Pin-like site-specific DNA recombinase
MPLPTARSSDLASVQVVGDALQGFSPRMSSITTRTSLSFMLKGATRREFDMIAAWSVDRLGRSLQHLVAFLGEVHAAGVDLYLHQQALDTTTPAGKAM